jgi:hypothetical protein
MRVIQVKAMEDLEAYRNKRVTIGSHHFENFVAIQSQEFFGKLNY